MLLICIALPIKTGTSDPKMSTGIAELVDVLEHFKFALNVAFFVGHECFHQPKSGNLWEVPREAVNIYNIANDQNTICANIHAIR